jgi:hypothetical protein
MAGVPPGKDGSCVHAWKYSQPCLPLSLGWVVWERAFLHVCSASEVVWQALSSMNVVPIIRCVEGDLAAAQADLLGLWGQGYSASDIIGTLFKVRVVSARRSALVVGLSPQLMDLYMEDVGGITLVAGLSPTAHAGEHGGCREVISGSGDSMSRQG